MATIHFQNVFIVPIRNSVSIEQSLPPASLSPGDPTLLYGLPVLNIE